MVGDKAARQARSLIGIHGRDDALVIARRTEADLRSTGRSQRAAVWAEIVEAIIAAQDEPA